MISMPQYLMKIAVVDLQGYALPDQFILKELSIRLGSGEEHFVFKPPFPYHQISKKDRRTVNVAETKLLGIRYSDGEFDYEDIDSILYRSLSDDVSFIYVRGHQKRDFLEKRLANVLLTCPNVVNTETLDQWQPPPPKCQPSTSDKICSHHMPGRPYRCTTIIAENIFEWIIKCLPYNE